MSDDDSQSLSSFSSDMSDTDVSDMSSVDLDTTFDMDDVVTRINVTNVANVTNVTNTNTENDDEYIIDIDVSDGEEKEDAVAAAPVGDIIDIEYRLQTSIFYVEPVTHITCQLMFVNSTNNTLVQIDTRIMRLTTPNIIDRFDIGRIIKASRYAPDGTLKFRLGSLFIYNAHVPPARLSHYVANPDAFSFVTPLTSISSFIIKPTMACFHSLNSIHIILHSLGVVKPLKPVSKTTRNATRRTVTITKNALATRRRDPKYRPH
jgi:hypothetical protein